jgi:hypothetical protein
MKPGRPESESGGICNFGIRYLAGSTAGSVGSAIAPALYTTAVVIMLTPLAWATFSWPRCVNNEVAIPTAAMIAAAVAGTSCLFPLLGARMALSLGSIGSLKIRYQME